MDEKYLEQASELEQDRRDAALLATRHKLQGPGQPYCDDCDEPIPEARRQAAPGAIRCIACQKRFERMTQ